MGAMIEHILQYGFGAHILDGPTGPIGKVKPGIIKMAVETQAKVVPFYTFADKAWFFNSWDRFMLPKPFARVTLFFGPPMVFDGEGNPDDFESMRLHIEQQMLPNLHL